MDRKKNMAFWLVFLMFFLMFFYGRNMEFFPVFQFSVKRLESQNMSKHSDFSSYDLTEISKHWTFQHFSFEYNDAKMFWHVLSVDKKDLCQVSIGQLESQCARGLASHEINVFTMFSRRILQVSGGRSQVEATDMDWSSTEVRHFLDQDLKILEALFVSILFVIGCCWQLSLNPTQSQRPNAAEMCWDFLRFSMQLFGSAEIPGRSFGDFWTKQKWILEIW